VNTDAVDNSDPIVAEAEVLEAIAEAITAVDMVETMGATTET
jgi:hypothetical protein